MGFLSGIQSTFLSGGTWMWVILILQVVSIAIIIERVVALYWRRRPDQLELSKEYESTIKSGQLRTLIEEMKGSHQPLNPVIGAGAQAAVALGGKDEIQGKMDEVLLAENAIVEKRTGFLAMLANVGTLTGLLGTIVGMIKSFSAVSTANPMEKATLLSSGISEAMNTTAYGLIMAIPALIMFSVLTNRATQLTEDLNQAALKIYNWLSYSFESIPRREPLTGTGKAEKMLDV